MYGYNFSEHRSMQAVPFQLMFARKASQPFQKYLEMLTEQQLQDSLQERKKHVNKHAKKRDDIKGTIIQAQDNRSSIMTEDVAKKLFKSSWDKNCG